MGTQMSGLWQTDTGTGSRKSGYMGRVLITSATKAISAMQMRDPASVELSGIKSDQKKSKE